jgi:hypothetical protein
MVYDQRFKKCIKISDYGETANKVTNCVLVKSLEKKQSKNLNMQCLRCDKGYSMGPVGVCEFINEPHCKVYDFASNRCSLCKEGYRLKQIDSDIKARNKDKKAKDSASRIDSTAIFNTSKNTGFIGLRIFNPDSSEIVKQIVDEVEVEQHSDCLKCPDGCERCVPGHGKKIAMDARKWIDTRCVYCTESE